jgi:polyhydroxyalkanoate synthesis regulator phasin
VSSVAGTLFQGTAVQQTDTIEDQRGRLIAQLEQKVEQAKKDIAERDARIAQLRFQVGRLETLLVDALGNNARRARP